MNLTKKSSLFPSKTINLIHLTLIIAALKNIIIWRYFEVFNENYFRAPLFDFLLDIPSYLGKTSLLLPLLLSPLLFLNNRLTALPYIFAAISSILAISIDFYGYHHDVAFSSIIFLLVAYSYLLKDKSICFGAILGTAASIYLLTGISKISPFFIHGDVVLEILSSKPFIGGSIFHPRLDILLKPIGSQLAYLTIFVELILSPVLVVLISKRFYMLRSILLIFHFLLFYTGRGTVFNILFPSILLLQIEYLSKYYSGLGYKNSRFSNFILSIATKICYFLITIYFIFLLYYSLKQNVFF